MVCLLVSSTDKWRIVFLQAPDFKLPHFHKVTQLSIYRAVKRKKKKSLDIITFVERSTQQRPLGFLEQSLY